MSIILAVIIFLIVVSSLKVSSLNQEKKELLKTVEWKLSNTAIVDVERIKEKQNDENSLKCLFYDQKVDSIIENKDLVKMESVTAIKLYGNSSLLFPTATPLLPEDTASCIISKGCSKALFGDEAAIGGSIQYGEKSYVVRDIIPEEDNYFLYETSEKQDQFSYIFCRQFDSKLGQETMEAYFIANDLIATMVDLDLSFENGKALFVKENTIYEINYLNCVGKMIGYSFGIVMLVILGLGIGGRQIVSKRRREN